MYILINTFGLEKCINSYKRLLFLIKMIEVEKHLDNNETSNNSCTVFHTLTSDLIAMCNFN